VLYGFQGGTEKEIIEVKTDFEHNRIKKRILTLIKILNNDLKLIVYHNNENFVNKIKICLNCGKITV